MTDAQADIARRQFMLRVTLFSVFALSGFAGLIYESIWGRYLKLFLGHAAYAQTFVIAIFMGGMSLGSWIASRYSTRWKNLLRWYAVTEGVIGLMGLLFHSTFEGVTTLAYETIMPSLGAPFAVGAFKLLVSTLLILPPSVLLGMTFPLMSAGMIRLFPTIPGSSISMLYFTNSIGAALGVLVSGFILVGQVGLPGTVLSAALLNVVVGIVVWFIAKQVDAEGPQAAPVQAASLDTPAPDYTLMLGVAALTGLASFMYEIGWIRMLSLTLGSSTHSFEIMLSAFIAGLAFGGLWIKGRIDGIRNPVAYLGVVQVVMGLLALSTIVLYGSSFEAMQSIVWALAKTDQGYALFNLGSVGICLLIMFPAAFCAGMTLPLITFTLLKGGIGEKSIGAVYAANTVGAILGVFFATHVGMTLLGLKGLIAFGAMVDMALGVLLLKLATDPSKKHIPATVGAVTFAALLFTLYGVQLDTLKMASGVYRKGLLISGEIAENVFHKDGKTATVDLVRYTSGDLAGSMSITTNGKPDAAINLADYNKPGPDEVTMALSAIVPLALHPEAETAAVIGMGSGMTSHLLVVSDRLKRVDTIEIEEAMVQGAERFGSRVEAVFKDPRSHVYIEDARTFFSTHNAQYDLIVSEPSNPWVSGVSSLFSQEFYGLIKRHLAPKGVLAQWFQLYEIEPRLVASVMTALSMHFSDYVIFATDNVNMLIVARNDARVGSLSPEIFENEAIARELGRYKIRNLASLELHRIGDKKLLHPLFASFGSPPNSDFFPFLDLNAVKSRYLQLNAGDFLALRNAPISVLEMLDDQPPSARPGKNGTSPYAGSNRSSFTRMTLVGRAESIRDYYLPPRGKSQPLTLPAGLQKDVELLKVRLLDCHSERQTNVWSRSLYRVANAVNPYLSPRDLERIWERFEASPCYGRMPRLQKTWLALFKAVGARDAKQTAKLAEVLLKKKGSVQDRRRAYLLGAAMTGHLAQGHRMKALDLYRTYSPQVLKKDQEPTLLLRLLYAHSVASVGT